jgi:hypothetical protein
MPNIHLLSKKVKKTPASNADPNRYDFLDLNNAEPDWGAPLYDNALAASDVDGTRKWLYLNIDGSNITIEGNITLSTTLDEVTTRGNTTTNGVTIGNLTVDNIFLDSNTISTLSNANLVLDPNGSGTVILESPLTQNATSAPSTPNANSMVTYVTASGTTPNREIAWKIKNQSGEEIIVSTLIV